ncbi:Cystathionine gamma-synthase [Propionicimonas sp. T2.31MG-18]|uniref:cystathionine gamma-synthase n=1 Tax=Propionicimonas sp. T2.31MG-18 TaxID=3157620 RepID=UPI0035EB42D8
MTTTALTPLIPTDARPQVLDTVAAARAADSALSPADPGPRQPGRTGPRTRAVRAGITTDSSHGAVIPPLYLSVSYAFDGLDGRGRYDYSRSGNPTRDLFAAAVADLEAGTTGCITGSGMGAITATVNALVPAGGTLLAPVDCYGGSWRLFDALQRTGRLSLRLVDTSDPGAIASAITEGCDLLWLETPSNPLLRITDVAAAASAAHRAGAVVVADNTFAGPVLQRPLELGADVVVHSATKYLNGHSDVVSGAVVTADPGLGTDIAWWANTLGVTGAPFDSYLALRGLRTLHLRMAEAQRNAAAVADTLVAHPAVRAVHYPGLADHPQHALAARQMDGFGAVVTMELAGLEEVRALVDGLRCFALAESLGGMESLISHPATMTHAGMAPQARDAAGITDGMVRLSLGIEEATDLVDDLEAGLDRVLALG